MYRLKKPADRCNSHIAKQTFLRDSLYTSKESQKSKDNSGKSPWQKLGVDVLPESGGADLQLQIRNSTAKL